MIDRLHAALAVLFCATNSVTAQPDEETVSPADEGGALAAGLLPIPDYSGKFAERAWLLGDFDGSRTDLANKGIQFNIEWTQTVQSIVDGGRDERTEYSGSVDYNLTLDLQKMDIMPGAIVAMRAESRYGDTVNSQSGLILPANTDGFFPIDQDDIGLALTTLVYKQFLSASFGVFLGKVDTLDGDPNEFASGRGVTQFMNASFNFNPVTGLTVPYSALAVGMFWAPTPNVQFTTTLMNAADSSTSSGFDDFGDGWLLSSELQFQYRLGELPGGQTFTALVSDDESFSELGSRLELPPGSGLDDPSVTDSWFVSWNGWQYLYTEDEPGEGPMNLLNRVPDLQGVGLFARAGIADENTNPTDWSFSVGIGGRGVIPGRDNDVFGVGYFYSHLQSSRFTGAIKIEDHVQGAEAFYNIALTPAASLALDGQVVESPLPRVDTTVILGMRFQLRF